MNKGDLPAVVHRVPTPCGNFRITVVSVDDTPVEVFCHTGRNGSCINVLTATIGRLCSYILQGRMDKDYVLRALHGATCPNGFWHEGKHYESCLALIAECLKVQRVQGEDGPVHPFG